MSKYRKSSHSAWTGFGGAGQESRPTSARGEAISAKNRVPEENPYMEMPFEAKVPLFKDPYGKCRFIWLVP
jgi:hypothetical protein